ncbi:MAG: LysM peptidoglycan-binding domain-containing protein [Nocardiaceae bacterium]|nr:LysM peptidoglycan-binding domain-containing protein [Microbacteriaceae bacterium]MCL2532703.1 LysM peptidoglycan-binding domain-containing protein [Nocardiaceae bacterium]
MSSISVHLSATGFPRPAARSRLRLTRRGRLVLSSVAAAPLVALALWFGVNSGIAGAAEHSAAASSTVLHHVTVQQGESLWQIAETIAPNDDPRDVIAAIVDLNNLPSSSLTPGQSLAVPAQYSK